MNGGSCAVGVGVGETTTEGLGVGATPTGTVGRRSGLATNSTPTIRTAMTAAATAAIQYGPRASGAVATAERTRSLSAGLGEPVTWSKTRFRSSRKFSLPTSEHLLHSEVRAELLGRAVDARLGGGGRHAKRPRHLVERKVEIEMKDERQALQRAQTQQGRM